MNYDQTNLPDGYNRGRDHGPAFLKQWMDVVATHAGDVDCRDILDLGCGTGRFSNALAARFNAFLIGIDPSLKMLHQAVMSSRGGRVFYASGLAEAVPLPARSVDMIFISMAFHHFTDCRAAAAECSRVLRHQGRLCLRTASVDRVSMYPYVPFFPASRRLLEERLPTLELQRQTFETASFRMLSCKVVTQQIAPDYSAYAEKLSAKGDSILASLDEKDFEAGLQALHLEAARLDPRPVHEPIDFVVFGKI